ncbi:MAG: DUF697 domain-containing protein [Thiofilum sp.]|uniref:YcjF family protein n=1 Tax=Thiofilum sp. TaxID=2212733 RepID=UPI0025E96EE3|nr:DUF697 domain-containing protein [Thiofilum sp.]MBK8452737.1 DUF697 domain-containing protein [Thiofilum sp.]
MSASDLISHVEQTDSQSDTTVDATPQVSSPAPTEAMITPEIMTPTDSVCEQKLDAYQHSLQRAGANNIVKNHIIASITLGLVPIPLFDLTALTTTQVSMLHSLSAHYQQPFKDRNMKALITALIGGSLPVASIMGLSSFTKLIPGIGSLVGSASLGVAAGATTYAIGQTFIKHFEAGGTIDSFEPKQAKVFFEEKFQEGKAFVKRLKEEVKASSSSNSTEKAEGVANSSNAS